MSWRIRERKELEMAFLQQKSDLTTLLCNGAGLEAAVAAKAFWWKKKIFRWKFHLKPKPSPGSPGCQLGGQERQIGALRGSSRVPSAQPIVVHNVAHHIDQWNTVDKV